MNAEPQLTPCVHWPSSPYATRPKKLLLLCCCEWIWLERLYRQPQRLHHVKQLQLQVLVHRVSWDALEWERQQQASRTRGPTWREQVRIEAESNRSDTGTEATGWDSKRKGSLHTEQELEQWIEQLRVAVGSELQWQRSARAAVKEHAP